jgi:hypothetical protein
MILIDTSRYHDIIVKVKIVCHLMSQVMPLRYHVHISLIPKHDTDAVEPTHDTGHDLIIMIFFGGVS